MKDEDLARMVNDTWNETDSRGVVNWENLLPELKNTFSVIGRRIYDAGFQAGADSVVRN